MAVYFILGIVVVVILFFAWNSKRSNDEHKKIRDVYNQPETVKIALWIDLNSVNGKNVDYAYSYWTKVRSNMYNSDSDVLIILFKPGIYDFTVSSKSRKEYKNIDMKVELHAGVTYQLGCNEGGVYFIEDPDSERYRMG